MLSIVPTLVAKLRGWRERQRVLDELYALDDRTLADIGLSRGDIPFVAKGQFRSPAPSGGHKVPANTDTRHAA